MPVLILSLAFLAVLTLLAACAVASASSVQAQALGSLTGHPAAVSPLVIIAAALVLILLAAAAGLAFLVWRVRRQEYYLKAALAAHRPRQARHLVDRYPAARETPQPVQPRTESADPWRWS